jgi:hypothetical protein
MTVLNTSVCQVNVAGTRRESVFVEMMAWPGDKGSKPQQAKQHRSLVVNHPDNPGVPGTQDSQEQALGQDQTEEGYDQPGVRQKPAWHAFDHAEHEQKQQRGQEQPERCENCQPLREGEMQEMDQRTQRPQYQERRCGRQTLGP